MSGYARGWHFHNYYMYSSLCPWSRQKAQTKLYYVGKKSKQNLQTLNQTHNDKKLFIIWTFLELVNGQ